MLLSLQTFNKNDPRAERGCSLASLRSGRFTRNRIEVDWASDFVMAQRIYRWNSSSSWQAYNNAATDSDVLNDAQICQEIKRRPPKTPTIPTQPKAARRLRHHVARVMGEASAASAAGWLLIPSRSK